MYTTVQSTLGSPPSKQDLDIYYVVFDILHVNGTSVIHRPLEARHELLKDTVKDVTVQIAGSPMSARVAPLLPDSTRFGGSLASRTGAELDDIKQGLEAARKMKEEGIMVKALGSPWEPNNRSYNWLKMKPDYVSEVDIDMVVIGGW
jgi:DNA ligase 4